MPLSRWIYFLDHLQHVLKAAWLIACKKRKHGQGRRLGALPTYRQGELPLREHNYAHIYVM